MVDSEKPSFLDNMFMVLKDLPEPGFKDTPRDRAVTAKTNFKKSIWKTKVTAITVAAFIIPPILLFKGDDYLKHLTHTNDPDAPALNNADNVARVFLGDIFNIAQATSDAVETVKGVSTSIQNAVNSTPTPQPLSAENVATQRPILPPPSPAQEQTPTQQPASCDHIQTLFNDFRPGQDKAIKASQSQLKHIASCAGSAFTVTTKNKSNEQYLACIRAGSTFVTAASNENFNNFAIAPSETDRRVVTISYNVASDMNACVGLQSTPQTQAQPKTQAVKTPQEQKKTLENLF